MRIGAMNNPQRDVLDEIGWMAEMRLDFIDLTLEPPAASVWLVDAHKVREALDKSGLGIVGHTPYYLPLASAFEGIRRAAVEEIRCCIRTFAELGTRWVNVHPDRHAPLHDRAFLIRRNLESLKELVEFAGNLGLGMMVENLPGEFNTATQLGELLDPLPQLGLHLDIGHANLIVSMNTTESILARFASRLKHVHLHDNKGGHADLHLPLGVGTLEARRLVRALRATGYDDTITLEVFAPDRQYLRYSVEILRRFWEES